MVNFKPYKLRTPTTGANPEFCSLECESHSGDWWCYFYKIPCERTRVTKQEDGSCGLPGFSSILDYNTIHIICADPERGKKNTNMDTKKYIINQKHAKLQMI